MYTREVIEAIQLQSGEITTQIISDLITDAGTRHARMRELYDEYRGHVEIRNREFDDATKVNSKLNNDYRGSIVDIKTGYLFGNSIDYGIDASKYSKSDYEKISQVFNDFKLMNNVEDLDATTGEYASVCGEAARLVYIDQDGLEAVMNIKPWEAIFIYDQTTDQIQYALIYYKIWVRTGSAVNEIIKVEWYDDKNVTFYVQGSSGAFALDNTEPVNPRPHMFDYVPVVRFANNNLYQGDFEKVSSLIDAYDRNLSDAQNEIEEFRLAYLAFYGVEPTPEDIKHFRQTGGISFPDGADGKFITKDLSGAVDFVENHKDTLNENIYKFSKTVDMSDENFSGGAQTGESRKWKIQTMENDAIRKERKFTAGVRQMFKVLQSAWVKKNIPFDYLAVQMQFKRNVPMDIAQAAETTNNLKGNVSENTRLSLLPFVKDPNTEIEQMKADAESGINLEDVGVK